MLVMLRCSGNWSWFLNVIFKALLPTWWSKTAQCIIHGLSYSCLYFWFMVGERLCHFNEIYAHPLLSYWKRISLINTCSYHYSSSARRFFLRQSPCWEFCKVFGFSIFGPLDLSCFWDNSPSPTAYAVVSISWKEGLAFETEHSGRLFLKACVTAYLCSGVTRIYWNIYIFKFFLKKIIFHSVINGAIIPFNTWFGSNNV